MTRECFLKTLFKNTLISLNDNISGVFTGILYKYGGISSAYTLREESEGG